jgi:uncharacterized protein (TIGR02246 family)
MSDLPEVRALVDAYAQRVDCFDPAGAADLFTEDGTLTVVRDSGASTLSGRDEIETALEALGRYECLMHVISSHTAQLTGDTGSGLTRCIAHHFSDSGTDTVMFIRYEETYLRVEGRWLFRERVLHVELEEKRAWQPT